MALANLWRQIGTALLVLFALGAAACSSEPAADVAALGSDAAPAQTEATAPTAIASNPESSPTASAAATTNEAATPPAGGIDDGESEIAAPPDHEQLRPTAPNGRIAPTVADTPAALADQVARAEAGLADQNSTPEARADFGHLHQVAIRKIGYEQDWDAPFFEALPAELRARTLLHVSARRALIDLSSGYDAADFIPAWGIVEPEPADALVSYYQEAETRTGIEWEFLAAINLVETGMGRIRGLSSAGAQGPMQFLPTTWDESGIGEGDINNPRDAINAAARYLVRRGGPGDMPGAIWGYNNSDDYVTAVRAYAEVLRQDPSAYQAIYNWEIYFFTEAGDVWLPTGFRSEESIDLGDFLAANPWSAPDLGIRAPDVAD